MKKLVLSIFCILGLNACTHQYSSFTSINEDYDASIGFVITTIDINNQNLDISFMVASNDIEDHENNLIIMVNYDGFPKLSLGEKIILQFRAIEENNIEKIITMTSVAQSQAAINEIVENQKKYPKLVKIGRGFLINKNDYKYLSNARQIHYSMTGNEVSVQGQFSGEAIHDLKKYASKLLNSKSYEPNKQTIDQELVELKKVLSDDVFSDFEKLERSKTHSDLEKNFGKQFTSNKINSKTGAIEETITVKISSQVSGPLVVGFDQQGKIVYVRNAYSESQIRWRK